MLRKSEHSPPGRPKRSRSTVSATGTAPGAATSGLKAGARRQRSATLPLSVLPDRPQLSNETPDRHLPPRGGKGGGLVGLQAPVQDLPTTLVRDASSDADRAAQGE